MNEIKSLQKERARGQGKGEGREKEKCGAEERGRRKCVRRGMRTEKNNCRRIKRYVSFMHREWR